MAAAPADQLLITVPPTAVSGRPFDVMITALDPYGNVDRNYSGTITWASSDLDPGVVLPADYTFQATDNGVVTFPAGVTLITSGNQTLTATDTASGIAGSATLTVTPPPGGRARSPTIPTLNTDIASAQGAPIAPELTCVDRLFASRHEAGLPWVRRKHDEAAEDLFDIMGGMLV